MGLGSRRTLCVDTWDDGVVQKIVPVARNYIYCDGPTGGSHFLTISP